MITNYFVQHGLAVSKDVDDERPLSATGIEQTRRVAARLTDQKIHIQKIYHSGKLRAAQTAQIFAEIMVIETVSALTGMNPDDSPQEIINQLSEDAVMYVGHLPNIQNVVSTIITGSDKSTVVKFQNSAVACIQIEQLEASLKWFLIADFC